MLLSQYQRVPCKVWIEVLFSKKSLSRQFFFFFSEILQFPQHPFLDNPSLYCFKTGWFPMMSQTLPLLVHQLFHCSLSQNLHGSRNIYSSSSTYIILTKRFFLCLWISGFHLRLNLNHLPQFFYLNFLESSFLVDSRVE